MSHFLQIARTNLATLARLGSDASPAQRLVYLGRAMDMTREAYAAAVDTDEVEAVLAEIGNACRRPPLAQDNTARGDEWEHDARQPGVYGHASGGTL